MILPIQVYTRAGCVHCDTFKAELNARGIPFLSYELDKDVSSSWFKENFPGKGMLPVVVTEGEVYSGPQEVHQMLNEYGRDSGKQLLNEDIEWRKGRTDSGDMM